MAFDPLDPWPGPRKGSSSAASYGPVAPDALVSFSVLCQPAAGGGLDGFRERLAASDTRALRPAGKTLASVSAQLRGLGFEVFDDLVFPQGRPGLAVVARGQVAHFEETFKTSLAIMTRRSVDDRFEYSTRSSGIALAENARRPSLVKLGEEAILVSVPGPPSLAAPVQVVAATGATAGSCVSLREVARHTNAAAVHPRRLLFRGRANGSGVRVAVIDTGFADHSFFDQYRVTRMNGPREDGDVDLGDAHGTMVLSNLLVCAPGVDAFAVKYFNPVTAFAKALTIPDLRVISVSWGFATGSGQTPDDVLHLEALVKSAVNDMGITVVAATGFLEGESTPARLQEVISVGGAVADSPTTESAWGASASFISTVYGTRHVPDLCGIASAIKMPVAGTSSGEACSPGSTSCATPQVAAAAALLRQKNPFMRPYRVRRKLMSFATDITTGVAYPNVPAGANRDDATGAGFVNALASWNHVVDAWWAVFWPWS